MKPTLNQADIELLKGVFATKDDLTGFATKDDLIAMEKRQDGKYATKNDLVSMEKRQDSKYATKEDLKGMEKRLTKRMDYVDKTLDREHVKLAKDVDRIKLHIGLQ